MFSCYAWHDSKMPEHLNLYVHIYIYTLQVVTPTSFMTYLILRHHLQWPNHLLLSCVFTVLGMCNSIQGICTSSVVPKTEPQTFPCVYTSTLWPKVHSMNTKNRVMTILYTSLAKQSNFPTFISLSYACILPKQFSDAKNRIPLLHKQILMSLTSLVYNYESEFCLHCVMLPSKFALLYRALR